MKKKWVAALLAVPFAALMVLVAGCSSRQTGNSTAGGSSSESASESVSSSASASDSAAASAGGAPDYAQKSSWYKIPEVTKDVDTFFIYATVYMGENEGDPDYATLDNDEMLAGVEVEHAMKMSAFEDSTNLFVPYYRQCSMKAEGEGWKKTGDALTMLAGIPYEDITAALDYYFENYNGGRPFVIAGHSQGSAILSLALKGYFKEHPDYYERMVAAYVVGYSITKDDLEANPYLKFATGEDDTGVIVSWHAEGPKNAEENAPTVVLKPNGISINPLNWKLDGTYAPASENKGSLVVNRITGTPEVRDIGADAQVIPERGTVVTNADAELLELPPADLFGPQSYHEDDYAIFYNNVKDNVSTRVEAYMTNHER